MATSLRSHRRAAALITTGSSSPYQDAVLADSPSGFWPMQELSGATAADVSGNSRDATYNGSVTLGAGGPGAYSGGLYSAEYTGATSSFADAGDLSAWETGAGSSGLFSVEGWFRLTGAPYTVIAAKGSASNYEWALWVTNTYEVAFSYYNAAGTTQATAKSGTYEVGLGTWFHIVGYFDKAGSTMGVILDGSSSWTASTTGTSITAGSSPMLFGKMADNFAPINGRLCNLAYYPTKLSAAQALNHHDAMFTAP